MARAFRKRRRSRTYEAHLEPAAIRMLGSLFAQTRWLLESAEPTLPMVADDLSALVAEADSDSAARSLDGEPTGMPGGHTPAGALDEGEIEELVARARAALDGPGSDPALHRLLPDARRDDPLASAEFRRRAGESVRLGKLTRLEEALAALEAVDDEGVLRLEASQAHAFAAALTDVRLVLGQRLGLVTDDDASVLERALADADPDDPRVALVLAYDFTTWLQEGLVRALL